MTDQKLNQWEINGKTVTFKLNDDAYTRLDQENAQARVNGGLYEQNAGMGAMVLINSFAGMLAPGEDGNVEVLPEMFNMYLTRIAYGLQSKLTKSQIEDYIDSLDDAEYSKFAQFIVNIVVPKKQRRLSITMPG